MPLPLLVVLSCGGTRKKTFKSITSSQIMHPVTFLKGSRSQNIYNGEIQRIGKSRAIIHWRHLCVSSHYYMEHCRAVNCLFFWVSTSPNAITNHALQLFFFKCGNCWGKGKAFFFEFSLFVHLFGATHPFQHRNIVFHLAFHFVCLWTLHCSSWVPLTRQSSCHLGYPTPAVFAWKRWPCSENSGSGFRSPLHLSLCCWQLTKQASWSGMIIHNLSTCRAGAAQLGLRLPLLWMEIQAHGTASGLQIISCSPCLSRTPDIWLWQHVLHCKQRATCAIGAMGNPWGCFHSWDNMTTLPEKLKAQAHTGNTGKGKDTSPKSFTVPLIIVLCIL